MERKKQGKNEREMNKERKGTRNEERDKGSN
jgi:hypothetical protein